MSSNGEIFLRNFFPLEKAVAFPLGKQKQSISAGQFKPRKASSSLGGLKTPLFRVCFALR